MQWGKYKVIRSFSFSMPKIAWHAQQFVTLSILKASCRFDCCPPGWLYSPVRMGNSSPKKSQISKVATLLNFIFWFGGVFWKSRQRISTRAHAFSNLLNWERYHLLHISLTAFILEEFRLYSNPLWSFFWKSLQKVKRSFLRFSNYKHRNKL